MSAVPLEFMECPVGNRFACSKCDGSEFFIALEASDDVGPASGPVDNIECTHCHQMFTVAVRAA